VGEVVSSNLVVPTIYLPILTMVGEVASSNLVVQPFFQESVSKILSKGFLYVAVAFTASIEQFERIHSKLNLSRCLFGRVLRNKRGRRAIQEFQSCASRVCGAEGGGLGIAMAWEWAAVGLGVEREVGGTGSTRKRRKK
jgi:hypothetical protein